MDKNMGRQTSQYSLFISVTRFTFYRVKSAFYMVNFLLFISVSVKRRLQTSDCGLHTR